MIIKDETRYKQDETGQWWYHFGKKNPCRVKASIKVCEHCKKEFVQSPIKRMDGKPVKHCSRVCGVQAALAKNPKALLGKDGRGGRWNGGRQVRRGYIWVWNPEIAQRMRPGTKKPYVLEHRIVMEQKLGRELLPTENVHHINGIRDDNRPENLELWSKPQPTGVRLNDKQHCATCTCK